MIRGLVLALITSGLIWISIAELTDGNAFLAANTFLGAIYVLLAPWLNQPLVVEAGHQIEQVEF